MTTHHADRKEAAASKRAAKDKEEEAADNAEDNADDDENDEGVYEVERVVGHRRDPEKGTLAYFLKWVGFSHDDSTWELEDHVFCTDLVAEYWQRHLEGGGSKQDIYGEEILEKKPKRGRSAASSSAGASSSTSSSNVKTNGSSARGSNKSLLPDVPPLGSTSSRSGNATSTTTSSSRRKEKASQEEISPNKRQKTSAATPSVPAKSSWTPPSSWTSWENEVLEVKDVERKNNSLVVHLAWKNGHESIHDKEEIHHKCPRKLLKFYEDHLKFREA
ncbi:hypothetical protein BGZ73_006790 [Actinomortierella ambigua]|nr:hypothetical protein BGZ73_006790 [Actinomortierella ambigua]